MHKSILRQIIIAVCIALMSFAAQAAGLGRMSVISALGEPLNAEIELLSTTPEELASITATIAPSEAYAAQGLERSGLQATIKVETTKRADGTHILKLTTQHPVPEPFLDMLIQVDWPTGRLLREYTALLDPPGYSAAATDSNPPAAMPFPQTTESMSVIPGLPEKKARKKSKTAAVMAHEVVSDSTSANEHETKRGDTLSAIARQMQVDGVSLDQMLVGLLRANKDAFVNDNMNRLKVGQIIRAPSAEELLAVSRQEASSEVRVQTADWNAYRNKLAGMVAEAPAASEDAGNQSSGGKLTAAAEDKASPASDGSRDVVRLSKSDTGDNANKADVKAMQDKLTALQGDTAREKGIKEANERIAMLDKQISDMQKLLAIKDQAMADLQKNAGTAVTAASMAKSAPAPVAAAKPTVAAVPPAPDVKPTEVKPVLPAKPLVDGLLAGAGDNAMLLGGVGGGLVLLGGAWLFFRNKRKHDLENFEQGILTAGGLKANTVFGNTSGDKVDTGDTSFLTDFSQSPGGMIDTHDVDTIAEAEILAYGREAQAEGILKDAIAKEPIRYELHLKLLEIYSARKDLSAFEAVSGELYSTLGAGDPVWARVAEMGHKIEPDNPLYDLSSSPAVPASTTEVKPAAKKPEVAASAKPGAAKIATAKPVKKQVKKMAPPPPPAPVEEPGGAKSTTSVAVAAASTASIDQKLEASYFDNAEDMGATETTPTAELSMEADIGQPEANAAAEIDLSGISLELDTTPVTATKEVTETPDAGVESEDVNTKLDLVTAYIDMGDKKSARELLDEVLKEGGAQQRERAKQMLSSLA